MFDEDEDDFDSREKVEDTDIYKKAMEIFELSRQILAVVPKDIEELELTIQDFATNAMLIPVKIAGAHGAGLYDIKMENAAIIRKAARELHIAVHGFKMYGFDEPEYFQLIRDKIEEFRILFAEWVKTFDEWNYITDRWGLFNPPGVNYDDKDPDEDIPYNPEN